LSLLDAGVPHAVLFVEDLESIDVQGIGRAIRSHHAFKPHGTNVNFVKPVDDHTIAVRTYERGVEAETLACGTGSVASAIAAVSMGRIAGFQVEHNPPRLLEEEVKYREQPRVLKQWLTPTGYQEYRSGATPASLRHAVVTVQTRSGDVLRVGFQTLIGEPNRKPQVMDVILEGDSKKVFEGIFSWQTRSG